MKFFRRKNFVLPELKNPQILIRKKERNLFLYDGERLVKTYKIVLGFEPEGDKQREGDGKTPEGEFYVAVKNPKSKYFLSLGLSYPSLKHAGEGLKVGLISQTEYDEIENAYREKRLPNQKTRLGGEIYIHGGGTLWDWTEGCSALENKEMEEIFSAVQIGTKILIEP
ncbi:MAG: L,D-transpeptidase family protein [Acidobacteriota bacterium]|nr:L,D-transpeptidase family protein [Acidobacteriota bacterium]